MKGFHKNSMSSFGGDAITMEIEDGRRSATFVDGPESFSGIHI